MMRTLCLLFAFVCSFLHLSAQTNDNLRIQFRDAASTPRNLVVCGDSVLVTVVVATNGNSSAIRSNISATINLFKGVEFVRLNTAASSAGVTVQNANDRSKPILNIPNLNPNAASSVNVAYWIRANCSFTDTLSVNDSLDVRDRWAFRYDLGSQLALSENDNSTEYRDALKVPFFTMSVSNTGTGGTRVGQCLTRKVIVSNSGLEGFVREFQYVNTQGAGITVQSITVNGRSIPITKQPAFNIFGDTLVSALIPADYFRQNTRGATATLADGDTLFESDETVTIIENICVANCNKPRSSTHTMSWGCDNRFCNSVSRNDLVRIGEGTVNVDFEVSPNNTDAGYCQKGFAKVSFRNQGVEIDAGTATMIDVSTGIGLGDNLATADKGYKITKIVIAGKTLPANQSGILDIRNNPQFTTDPDGVGGLTDADNDGFFDDLPINEKIDIEVDFEVDCNVFTSSKKCKNDYETAFGAEIDYTNVCGERKAVIQPRFYSPLNVNDLIENCATPDTKTDGEVFFIEHLERRNVFFFSKNANGEEYFEVKVKLPQGVSVVMDSTMFLHFTDVLPAKSDTMQNDTLVLAFDASAEAFLNGDYKLRLGLRADCSAAEGLTQFPIQISHVAPPCACSHVWYCDTITGPKIHRVAPCPLTACPKGLKTTAFDAVRTTFGFTDVSYTTPFDSTKANRHVAIPADSVRMTIKNIVGTAPINDSVGMVITYQNVDTKPAVQDKDIFKFNNGYVHITHGGQSYTCTVDSNQLTKQRIDSTHILTFNLNQCVKDLGFSLVAGDSVNFVGNFMVLPDGAFLTKFKKIPVFRGYGFWRDENTNYACDDFGTTFTVAKTQTVFSFPSGSDMPRGCSNADLDYKLLTVNNGFRDFFGNEFRQSVAVDSIVFDYDPAFVKSFKVEPLVSFANHPVHGNNFFSVPAFDTSGHYVVRFDTLRRVPSLNIVASSAFDFRIALTPNCQSFGGSGQGTNQFDFEPKMYFQDRFYASSIGNGENVLLRRDTVKDGDITFTEPPILAFTPTANTDITPITDTAEWTLQLCNSSTEGNAGITFLNLVPDAAVRNLTTVLSVQDITDPLQIQNLNLKKYGVDSTSVFVYSNGLQTANSGAAVNDFCNVYKVRVLVKNCGETKIKATSGWNCVPYDSLWNPTLYPPCIDQFINLKANTLAPNIDGNYVNQSTTQKPEICDTTVLEVLLRNTDLGKVFDVRSRFTIPLQGATLLLDSVEIAYPSGSPYRKAVGRPVRIGANQRGQIYEFTNFATLSTYLHQNGLAGFNPDSPNDSNEYKIRFRFVNDCEFRSGSLSYFSFSGKSSCGTNSNFETGESLPLQIAGTEGVNKEYEVNASPNNKLVPAGESLLEVTFKNLTDTPSDSTDKVTIKLPIGIDYVPNSANLGEPTQKTASGITILYWQMPLGLLKNQTGTLRFRVATPDSLACDGTGKDIAVATIAEKTLACSILNANCITEIITTSGGERYYALPLSEGTLVVTADRPIQGNQVTLKKGETVRLVASGGLRYLWRLVATDSIVSRDSVLTFTPVDSATVLRVTAGDTARCLGGVELRVISEDDRDTVPPTIFVRDSSLSCRDTFPTAVVPRVTDNRDSMVLITNQDRYDTLRCGVKLVRTWTATDRDGNRATATQTFTKIDTVAPIIVPKNPLLQNIRKGDTLTFECENTPVFAAKDVRAMDDCDTSATVDFEDLNAKVGKCAIDGYYLLMHCQWVAKDKCGNQSTFDFFIKITDNSKPTFTTPIPRDTTVNREQDVPKADTLRATDNCQVDNVPVTLNENRVGNIITRTWTATDPCGNTATASQRITIRPDTVPPVITPKDTIIRGKNSGDTVVINGCDVRAAYLYFSSVTVSDNLTANPTLRIDSTVTSTNTCTIEKKYTYTATDSVGNTSTFVIVLKITDKEAPRLQGVPPNLTLSPNDQVPPRSNSVTATDNCDPNPDIAFFETRTFRNNDSIITRVWTATDRCGNSASQSQIITKTNNRDTIPPVFEPKDTIILGKVSKDTVRINACSAAGFSLVMSSVSVRDNKDIYVDYTLDSTVQVLSACRTLKTYTYKAQDLAGNKAEYIIYLLIGDTEAPRLQGVPRDTLVEKRSQVPPIANVTATDNCSNPIPQYTQTQRIVGRDTILSRTWTATDACGNATTGTQLITIRPAPEGEKKDTITIIKVGDKDTLCLPSTFDGLPIGTISEACTDTTLSVKAEIIGKCIVFTGVKVGNARNCFTICDTAGKKCDTLVITTTVTKPTGTKRDSTVSVEVGKDNVICIPTTSQGGTVISSASNCADTSRASNFVIVQPCMVVNGIEKGTGKACLVVCDNQGICDTINLTINVTAPQGTTKDTSIRIDVEKRDTICFPNSTTSITSVCPDTSRAVDFEIVGKCVIVKGIVAGSGRGCFVVCDSVTNRCDTININVTVVDNRPKLLPVALPDTAKVLTGGQIDIPVLKNDTIKGTLKDSISIFVQPKNGTATVVRDSSGGFVIRYTPAVGYCDGGKYDEFRYSICNENGCDMTSVQVKVLCDKLIIYTAISPNGDRMNDIFFIDGLEQFPNTKVSVYNRWGNKLYDTNDYKNDWGGEWNGQLVPDGTYYYQVILENGTIYAGYLNIRR